MCTSLNSMRDERQDVSVINILDLFISRNSENVCISSTAYLPLSDIDLGQAGLTSTVELYYVLLGYTSI